ncbi:hypothetical protein [Streptomyces sp. enrichment culture]|uniref:hypothetical protein n=1 Tax=Streptomyces sp. enrichment culture TaxID=1795815 RepID=UPI003F543A86
MTEMAAAAAAKASVQAARLVQGAASPYVMVKHGRREDRAAAYDRFIAACVPIFHSGELDQTRVTEIYTALLAIELRAPAKVRAAAHHLFERLVGPFGLEWTIWQVEEGGPTQVADDEELAEAIAESQRAELEALEDRGPGPQSTPYLPSNAIRSSETFRDALDAFTSIAREDVTSRWWHALLTPWGKRWWMARH